MNVQSLIGPAVVAVLLSSTTFSASATSLLASPVLASSSISTFALDDTTFSAGAENAMPVDMQQATDASRAELQEPQSLINALYTATPLPESESLAILLANLGLMGTIARRRNRKDQD